MRALSSFLCLALLSGLGACCGDEPAEALPIPPDCAFRTGVEFGDDIAVWICADGERVVAHRHSSAFTGCRERQIERVPCGKLAPFEQGIDLCPEPSAADAGVDAEP